MQTGSPHLVRRCLFVGLWLAALTAVGFFLFPGHTYLQSDTQIYVPMLEHLWDPSAFQHDFMVQRPHMAFTIYDEMALALRRLTGLGFREVLLAQDVFFRFLGLLGIFLISVSLKFADRVALLVTAVFGLGAVVAGPAVLTIEYEPLPRAFALPLLFLAIGLIAHGRDLSAGVAASLAFLYHPTTTLAFWGVYFALACWPGGGFAAMRRRVLGLAPLLVAVILLLIASRMQAGVTEPPDFLSRIAPWWEQVLRLRSTYLWTSMWYPHWFWHYAILAVAAGIAFFRLHRSMPADLRFFMAGLPVLGLLSVPFSWLLLEKWKLALAPQLQPARNVLFLTVAAILFASMAAVKAAQSRRRGESFLWFVLVFAVPAGDAVHWTLFTRLADPLVRRRLFVDLACAGAAAGIAWAGSRPVRWWFWPAWGAVLLLPFYLYPAVGKVQNYPRLHTEAIVDLSDWAGSATPKDAIFLFADAGRDLAPGVFRATALRAVYVDWKSGGQGNYLPSVAREWWKRWHAVDALKFKSGDLRRYARLGIDYVVLTQSAAPSGVQPVFQNTAYRVYQVR